jgi:hypothetical protein
VEFEVVRMAGSSGRGIDADRFAGSTATECSPGPSPIVCRSGPRMMPDQYQSPPAASKARRRTSVNLRLAKLIGLTHLRDEKTSNRLVVVTTGAGRAAQGARDHGLGGPACPVLNIERYTHEADVDAAHTMVEVRRKPVTTKQPIEMLPYCICCSLARGSGVGRRVPV